MNDEKQIEEKAKQAQREYGKKWRAKNKDKVKEYNKRFWQKQAEKKQQNTEGCTENE